MVNWLDGVRIGLPMFHASYGTSRITCNTATALGTGRFCIAYIQAGGRSIIEVSARLVDWLAGHKHRLELVRAGNDK